MTPQERQEFFNREGYWPLEFVPRKVSAREAAEKRAYQLQMATRSRFRSAWKQPLHWDVPQAFERPGQVFELLTHELGPQEGQIEFLRQVETYYRFIRDARVEDARRRHTKWAIKQVMRNFETQVRGFRGQHVGRKGSIFGRGSGQEHHKASNTYSDILVLPERLVGEGRLVREVALHLRAYGVRAEDQKEAQESVRVGLEKTWGISVPKDFSRDLLSLDAPAKGV